MRRLPKILLASAVAAGVLLAGAAGFVWHRFVPLPNPPEAPADYADQANWVCRPGRIDSCATDLNATAIKADGSMTPLPAKPAADPPIDCFYVYPTVSRDRTANARLALSEEVTWVTRDQFARFSTVCRPFAPIYRQSTLRSLMAEALHIGRPGDMDLAYGDVRDAWRYYLQHDNNGRGVVLVGHSQGSRMLKRLIQQEIDGKPAQALLLSAMLLGNSVLVPPGKDTGGDFSTVKLCHAASQTGCVIAYSSFRASAPPPPHSRYGRNPGDGMAVACTNPAALGGGKAVLDAYFPAKNPMSKRPWTDLGTPATTPFVTLPGLISGECMHDADGAYLSISLNGQPGDHRITNIDGDVVVFGKVRPEWGLHLIDVNLTQGNLLAVVQAEAASFAAARR